MSDTPQLEELLPLPGGDQVECAGAGHEFPPEAVQLSEQELDAAEESDGR